MAVEREQIRQDQINTLQSSRPQKETVSSPRRRTRKRNSIVTFNVNETSLFKDEDIMPLGISPEPGIPNVIDSFKSDQLNTVGRFLQSKLRDGSTSLEELLDDQGNPKDIPNPDIEKMIDGFMDTGFISKNQRGDLQLTSRGKNTEQLGYDDIKSTYLAVDALTNKRSHRQIRTISDIQDTESVTDKFKLTEIDSTLREDSSRVLYLSEILVGNNTSDIGFLGEIIDRVKTLPEEMKPQVTVVSGLMEGSHKFRNKDKRLGLVQGLDQQYASAKLILNELQDTGSKVVYVLSDNDREIARDGTIEAMRIINNLAKPLQDSQKGSVTYWQQDQLKQNEAWDQNLRFQLDVVFPYSLKSGRRLRSADEVSQISKGKLRIEEYLLLWDAYHKLSAGEEVPNGYKKVLEVDNIPYKGKPNNGHFIITDGFDLKQRLKSGKDITYMVREGLKFGSTSMYQSPTDAAEAVQKQLSSDGQKLPNMLTVLDQQQSVGVGGQESWVVFAPGFTDSKKTLKQKGTIARAGQPVAWRQITTRKSMGEPGATSHEITDDGRHIITVFNRKLLEKADATSERRTIATFTDWQTGSTTARPDLQVKFADVVMETLKDRPTYLFTDGDIIQGRNYKGMPEENAHIGLVRIEDQQIFVKEMLERSFDHVTKPDLENLLKVGIVPGNHEWNSGYVLNGAIFNLYLAQVFQEMFTKKGITPGPDQIKAYESVKTSNGDFFKAWTAIEKDIAGYGTIFQHMMLEKGGKGGGGSRPPVFQAQGLFEGQGSNVKDVDLGVFGHWHHPQYGMFGNKLAVVSPSLAGISGFEWARGHRASMGGTLIHLGGGLPPQVEFLNTDSLNRHKINDGYFSDKNLKKAGFKDDVSFDAGKHGFSDRRSPKSALQKSLWELRDEIIFAVGSDIGA